MIPNGGFPIADPRILYFVAYQGHGKWLRHP